MRAFTITQGQPEGDGSTAFCGAVVSQKGGHAGRARLPKLSNGPFSLPCGSY